MRPHPHVVVAVGDALALILLIGLLLAIPVLIVGPFSSRNETRIVMWVTLKVLQSKEPHNVFYFREIVNQRHIPRMIPTSFLGQ